MEILPASANRMDRHAYRCRAQDNAYYDCGGAGAVVHGVLLHPLVRSIYMGDAWVAALAFLSIFRAGIYKAIPNNTTGRNRV